MTRRLSILDIHADPTGTGPTRITAQIVSKHLKGQPVDSVALDIGEAIRLQAQLAQAIATVHRALRDRP